MASTAISAQGSQIFIGGAAGSAKTISGVTAGATTTITASGHGFAKGDLVTFASVGGVSALNGQTVPVASVTSANAFVVNIDTTGATYTSGGTATSYTYTQIKNFKTYNGFDGAASEIDVTNMDSPAKEFRLGLVDSGKLQIGLDQDNSDAGQILVRQKRVSGALTPFKLVLPNADTAAFTAFVKTLTTEGGVDNVVRANSELRISGPVTWV